MQTCHKDISAYLHAADGGSVRSILAGSAELLQSTPVDHWPLSKNLCLLMLLIFWKHLSIPFLKTFWIGRVRSRQLQKNSIFFEKKASDYEKRSFLTLNWSWNGLSSEMRLGFMLTIHNQRSIQWIRYDRTKVDQAYVDSFLRLSRCSPSIILSIWPYCQQRLFSVIRRLREATRKT